MPKTSGVLSRIGQKRLYSSAYAERGRPDVIFWEAIPIVNNQVVRIMILSTNSPRRQGIWFFTDNGFQIDGSHYKTATLWADLFSAPFDLQCQTRNGFLSFYNVFQDKQNVCSQMYSMGMIATVLANGSQYNCNDVGFDKPFDALVFRLSILD